ncbi:unnamed protein product [Adineta steineri]|uniref:Uncharacterized protein n=1 Tax=Adineta steineri TaxID=433720 RepID=A0A814C4P6_9BILA|nr:unnamed protein product [Adineta steineri]
MKFIRNATINNTRHCVKCSKSNSISTCDGCHLTFCERHAITHRQELTDQLENIIQDHNLLRQDIEQTSNEYLYSRKIDKWEQESIRKIRTAAENVRIELKQIFDKTKIRLTRISRAIAFDLKSSCKTDDYLENDLKQWIKQLNDLRLEFQSSYSLELIEDQQSPIYLIKTINKKFSTIHKNTNHIVPHSTANERFLKAIYPASIASGGLIAKHMGPDLDYGYIIGKQHYSQGSHIIRFQIIQNALPYRIFFGCISSDGISSTMNYDSSFVVGWFGHNEIYQHGIWNNNINIYGYDSNKIQTNDILYMIFDCDKKQIGLYHERLNKTHKLSVNIDKAPFPWQLLIILTHENDSVKILNQK